MIKKLLFAAVMIMGAIPFIACGGDDPTPIKELPDKPADENVKPVDKPETKGGKMVVGYFPTYGSWFSPDWSKLTHICIAFAYMKADGVLDYTDVRNNKGIIDKAHDNGVKVLLSLRDADNATSGVLADAAKRNTLVGNVKRCFDELEFDGVDVDYEEWGGDEAAKSRNLEAFYKDLRVALGQDKLITAAVGGMTGPNSQINAQLLSHLDYVFPMVYDQCGGWAGGGWGSVGQHSSYEYFEDVVRYFINDLGVPKEKLCPGVPFYGYQFKSSTSTKDAEGIAYRDILGKYTDAHLYDNKDLIWYNGPETISKKAKSVMDKDLAGIMIWEVTQDTDDASKSLINAIDKAFKGK